MVAAVLVVLPATGASAYTDGENRITLARSVDGTYQVFTVLPDGTSPRQLTSSAGNKCDPAMSPDGRTVAFAQRELKVVDVASPNGDVTVVARDGEFVRSPAWSPDGLAIVFMGSIGWAGGTASDWVTEAFIVRRGQDGVWGGPVQLTNLGKSVSTPTISPDGLQLAYSYGDTRIGTERDLYVRALADVNATPMQVTRLLGGESVPQWHPSGGGTTPHELLFTTCGGAVYRVKVVAGASPVKVVQSGGCVARWATKTPSKIVYDGGGALKVLDLGTGRSSTISRKTTDRMPDW